MPALPYSLIAIDLDGTLLGSDHAVSDANRAALHRAHEAGLHVVLCTGRAYAETVPVIEQIGLDLDATITVFGAVVTDVASGKTVERTAIDRDTAAAALDWFQQRGYTVLWLTDRDQCGHDGYAIAGDRRHPAIDAYLAKTQCEMHCVDALPSDWTEPLRISIIDDLGVLEPVSAELAAAFDGRLVHNVLRAPSWELTVIEAFAPHVNKWFGIETLCRRWELDPSRTVAVGDDVNDIEMVRHAGLGVAMGNARDEVKAVAKQLTRTNDEDGVAALIDELLGR